MDYGYCTPLNIRECPSQPTPTILSPIDLDTNVLRAEQIQTWVLCRTIESTDLRKFLQLHGRKTTVTPTEDLVSSQGNIIGITNWRMNDMTNLLNFS